MSTNADSIEIDISDNEINENDEYLEVNNQKIYKIYGMKINDFLKRQMKLNYLKTAIIFYIDLKRMTHYFDSDSDSSSDFETLDKPKKFKKVNLNLYHHPYYIDRIFDDYFDETVSFDKISKVKDPWLLDNEFNQDGFDSLSDGLSLMPKIEK